MLLRQSRSRKYIELLLSGLILSTTTNRFIFRLGDIEHQYLDLLEQQQNNHYVKQIRLNSRESHKWRLITPLFGFEPGSIDSVKRNFYNEHTQYKNSTLGMVNWYCVFKLISSLVQWVAMSQGSTIWGRYYKNGSLKGVVGWGGGGGRGGLKEILNTALIHTWP